MEKSAFLASEYTPAPADKAAFHVIPVPLEASVSYGNGTSRGPAAILEASQQLEATDGNLAPGRLGIHTCAAICCQGEPEQILQRIEHTVTEALLSGATPLLLGGEHTVTLGAARAFKAAANEIGFVQFDAHADLRDSYEGSPLSHASVMRRISELGFPVAQFGVRAISVEEIEYRHQASIHALDAEELTLGSLPFKLLPDNFPRQVYVTFDIDALDPSLMPATGTPVPGGLFWREAVQLLNMVAAERHIIGADIVELAPITGLHHADFTAATLAHRLLGLMIKQ